MATILIAEDDLSIRKAIGMMVEKLGHSPIHCEDGQSAFEVLASGERVDLLITDVMMPRMDGRDLIRRVREDARLANMPIIIASAVVCARDVFALLELGATCFQAKPISLLDLQRNIHAALSMEPPAAETSRTPLPEKM